MTSRETQIADLEKIRDGLLFIDQQCGTLRGWMPCGFAMGRVAEASDLVQRAILEINDAIKERQV